MKVLICGGRSFYDYDLLKKEVDKIKNIKTIISGGARGADRLAIEYAKNNNIPCKIVYPAWDTLGKKAGFIRNKLMVDMLDNNDLCIAFWDGKSKGTKHTIDLCKNKNIKLNIIYYSL